MILPLYQHMHYVVVQTNRYSDSNISNDTARGVVVGGWNLTIKIFKTQNGKVPINKTMGFLALQIPEYTQTHTHAHAHKNTQPLV